MAEKIKTCDIVKVKASGKVGVIIEVQYKHDRYHIRGLSNWQYGIDDLEKVEIDSLIATIERQKAEYEQMEERMEKRTSMAGKLQDEYDEERDKNLNLLGEINAQKNLIESQKEEIARHQEHEFNHYPMEILELETRIFKLQEDLEAAHDGFEMLPPKDVEIHERTQFQIDKTVDRLLIESLQKEIKRLQWAASNAFDNLNQLKSADVEEAKQFLYKALTE